MEEEEEENVFTTFRTCSGPRLVPACSRLVDYPPKSKKS